MRKTSLRFALPLVLLFAVYGVMCKTKADTPVHKGFAVVELFTSEGCSSCPSAEAAVARLFEKGDEQVYILAYHVDYWNRLGWKDSFSKAEYSERQKAYANRFKLNSVYTPQVVVNGTSEFVGSDEMKMRNSVAKSLEQLPPSDLSITTSKEGNGLEVNYFITGTEEVILNLALVQPQATTVVKRGENRGKTLHHVNIVRAMKTIDAKGDGTIALEVPKELTGIPLELFAFTQSKKDLKILGADKQ